VDKDMADLHLKPTEAMNHSKWREIIRGNLSDINRDTGYMG